jgi:general secretion pathway protein D
LRLKDGETQILAGLLNNTDLKGATKVPGLGDIPFFGRLFSSHSQDKRKTEIVLAMTPRIIRNIRQPDADQTTYWSGTDNAVKILPIMSGKTEVIRMDGQGVVTGGRPLRTPVLPQPTPVPVAAEPAAPVQGNTAPAVDNKAPAQMAPEKPAPMVSVPAPVSVPFVPAGQSTRQQLITDAFRVAPAPLKAPQPEKSSATEEAPQAADTQ